MTLVQLMALIKPLFKVETHMRVDMENQENSAEKELLILEIQVSVVKRQDTISQASVNMLYLKKKPKITHQHTLLHSALKILGLLMISQADIT
jgi:hypothetical protein